MAESYEKWRNEVRVAFDSLNLPAADWQAVGVFDYRKEYDAGVKPQDAAMKANRYWWREWNKSLNQDCRKTDDCWLPRGHQGQCQPVAEILPLLRPRRISPAWVTLVTEPHDREA